MLSDVFNMSIIFWLRIYGLGYFRHILSLDHVAFINGVKRMENNNLQPPELPYA